MTMHECPKCGKEMLHQEAEPDVGITSGFWFCTACNYAELEETIDSEEPEPSDADKYCW